MRAAWLVVVLVAAGCLTPPPAAAPETGASAPAEPSTPVARPATSSKPLVEKPKECPLLDGSRQACREQLICQRDADGCEKCVCKEDLESDGSTVEPLGLDPREK
jgi:hypothetical protein